MRPSLRRSVIRLVLAAAAGALLAGCVAYPAYRVSPPVTVYDGAVYAPVAPPPPYVEVVPLAPSPVHVWINGFWGWGGSRYDWRPGHWAMPPRPGAHWQPPHWQQGPHGWQQQGGRWRR